MIEATSEKLDRLRKAHSELHAEYKRLTEFALACKDARNKYRNKFSGKLRSRSLEQQYDQAKADADECNERIKASLAMIRRDQDALREQSASAEQDFLSLLVDVVKESVDEATYIKWRDEAMRRFTSAIGIGEATG